MFRFISLLLLTSATNFFFYTLISAAPVIFPEVGAGTITYILLILNFASSAVGGLICDFVGLRKASLILTACLCSLFWLAIATFFAKVNDPPPTGIETLAVLAVMSNGLLPAVLSAHIDEVQLKYDGMWFWLAVQVGAFLSIWSYGNFTVFNYTNDSFLVLGSLFAVLAVGTFAFYLFDYSAPPDYLVMQAEKLPLLNMEQAYPYYPPLISSASMPAPSTAYTDDFPSIRHLSDTFPRRESGSDPMARRVHWGLPDVPSHEDYPDEEEEDKFSEIKALMVHFSPVVVFYAVFFNIFSTFEQTASAVTNMKIFGFKLVPTTVPALSPLFEIVIILTMKVASRCRNTNTENNVINVPVHSRSSSTGSTQLLLIQQQEAAANMIRGLVLSSVACLFGLGLEIMAGDGAGLNFLVVVPQTLIISIAEVLFSVSALKYAAVQKSYATATLQSVFFLAIASGCLILLCLDSLLRALNNTSTVRGWLYGTFAVLILLSALAFHRITRSHFLLLVNNNGRSSEEQNGNGSRSGPSGNGNSIRAGQNDIPADRTDYPALPDEEALLPPVSAR